MGLRRQFRITKKREFEQAYSSDVKYIGACIIVYAYKRSDTEPSRLGITVSKKVSKKATVRNRIKRLIREVFRLNQPWLNAGYNVVVISRRYCVDVSFSELKKQLRIGWEKCGVLDTKNTDANSIIPN